ncbi:MAG: choice-of-anchor tandem repeat GloVer-containing protein [Terriglobales bacterium]
MRCSGFNLWRGAATLAFLSLLLLISARPAQAQTEKVVYSFGSQSGDGGSSWAGLVFDKKGNLYGTTSSGGDNLNGTVFEITSGTEKVLYSFGSRSGDGNSPVAGLVIDKKGNLYGTTEDGGEYSEGTVFEITSAGEETVLYSFGSRSGDGSYPVAGLVLDTKDNLYGTTSGGGTHGGGTVFEISSAGEETLLYSFGSRSKDGNNPVAGLVFDTRGDLYGTTRLGGEHNEGTVFEITSAGEEKVLHSFGGRSGDGYNPVAGLVFDTKGNLYGTTQLGGEYNDGTVFEITSGGTEKVLHTFAGGAGDGAGPLAGLVFDKKGNLYGTTVNGGADGSGTVFEITSSGTEKLIYSFAGGAGDGAGPFAGLVFDKSGNLYGTTINGGAYSVGTVFEVTP